MHLRRRCTVRGRVPLAYEINGSAMAIMYSTNVQFIVLYRVKNTISIIATSSPALHVRQTPPRESRPQTRNALKMSCTVDLRPH